MNITEIVPTEVSGYCDAQTGECITTETGTPQEATIEDAATRPADGDAPVATARHRSTAAT